MVFPGPAPDQPTAERFDTPARRRLAASVHQLIEATLTAERVGDATLEDVTERVDALVRALYDGEPNPGTRDRWEGAHAGYLVRSPVMASANPVAPAVEWRTVGSRVIGEVSFGAPYEGPPGYVHGGVLALVFDEMLGMVNLERQIPGMTAVLTVKYRRPTPLFQPVTFEAWVERSEGRKTITRGSVRAGDVVTCECEGLFVTPDMERILEYFARSAEPPDPLP